MQASAIHALRVAASATLLTSAVAFAQSGTRAGSMRGPGPTVAQPEPAAPDQAAPDQAEPLLSVKFPGGTAAEYVKYLKGAASFPVNVILSPSARDVEIAPIELENVDVETAVRSIAAATDDDGGDWNIEQIGPRRQPRMTANGFSFSEPSSGQPAFRVDYRKAIAASQNTPDSDDNAPEGSPGQPANHGLLQVSVNSVRDLLKDPGAPSNSSGVTPETLLSAVEAALQMTMQGDAPASDVKFHPETSLLIVRGNDSQQVTVRSLLDQLRNDAASRNAAQDSRKQDALREIQMKAALDEARTQRRAAEDRLAAAVERMNRVRKLQESGTVAAAEVDAATAEFQNARTERDLAMLKEEQQGQVAKVMAGRADSWIALLINTKSLSPADFDRFDKTIQTIIFSGQDHFGGHFPAADRSNIRLWTDDQMATRLDELAKEFGCDSYRDFPSDPPAAASIPPAPAPAAQPR